MSRLVNPEGVGKQRDRLAKATVLALRELATIKKPDDRARDLVAFMALALEEIDLTIDETCRAWEKRDYWIKADQFRMQWAWAKPLSTRFAQIALQDKWGDLPRVIPELATKLGGVTLPKRNVLGQPWVGAFDRLKARRADQTPAPWRPKKKA